MSIAANPVAGIPLGGLMHIGAPVDDPDALRPFKLLLGNVDCSVELLVESMSIIDTMGQQATANFELYESASPPTPGERIEFFYYAELLFSGFINRVERTSEVNLSRKTYQCQCADVSTILVRHKVRRNFTSTALFTILNSVIDIELAGEGFSIGTVDLNPTIPLVDSDGASVMDMLRDTANAAGLSMLVGFDRKIHMLSTTNDQAPAELTNANVMESSMIEDLESYRNVQTVIVTGTPADSSTDANTVTVTQEDSEEITARQILEGGTGRYEDVQEITHPTSNDAAVLLATADGYAALSLAAFGQVRRTIRARVRGYGWRAGQFVNVTLPHLATGTDWMVQRVSITELGREHPFAELEIVESSLQQRAYQSWLRILEEQKVTITIPGFAAQFQSTASFETAGSFSWVVPAGVTQVLITAMGGSASGGGGLNAGLFGDWPGGAGGKSGKVFVAVNVTAGEQFDLVIGGKGSPGGTTGNFTSTPGTHGNHTTVHRAGAFICQADRGNRGLGATLGAAGVKGANGGGSGGVVTVGGGKTGGAGASGATVGLVGGNGKDGSVVIQY